MEVDEENFEYLNWLWKLNVFLAIMKLWQLKRALEKKAIAQRKRPAGRKWTRLHNTEENREKHSFYNTILRDAALADHYTFFSMLRMTFTTFEELHNRLGKVESLVKRNTRLRKAIPLGKNQFYFTILQK